MVKKWSGLREAATKDSYYESAVSGKDLEVATEILRKEANEKGSRGLFWHGSTSPLSGNTFRRDVSFFSNSREFAADYASSKSFEQGLDAGTVTTPFYLFGNIFDPSRKEHVVKVSGLLPEKIRIGSSWGFGTEITREEWAHEITGSDFTPVKFTEKDLAGATPGKLLPDNEVHGKPLRYELVAVRNNFVYYAPIGTMRKLETSTRQKIPSREIISDLVRATDSSEGWGTPQWFRSKYGEQSWCYRTPVASEYKEKYFDTWTLFEGDPAVFRALLGAHFKIVKMREKSHDTFAALRKNVMKLTGVTYDDTGALIPLSQRFDPNRIDIRY